MLRKSESELVKQVFDAQRIPSNKNNDWVSEVESDLKSCDINYTAEQIKSMSQFKFKRIIKEAIQLKVMAYLFALQNKHSKSEKLILESEMQSYLKSSEISTVKKQMLNIKANFSSMNKNNLQCSLCKEMSTTENEEHLLVCSVLANHPKLKDDIGQVKFEDVFSDEQKQFRAAKVFKQIMEIFDRMKSQ